MSHVCTPHDFSDFPVCVKQTVVFPSKQPSMNWLASPAAAAAVFRDGSQPRSRIDMGFAFSEGWICWRGCCGGGAVAGGPVRWVCQAGRSGIVDKERGEMKPGFGLLGIAWLGYPECDSVSLQGNCRTDGDGTRSRSERRRVACYVRGFGCCWGRGTERSLIDHL